MTKMPEQSIPQIRTFNNIEDILALEHFQKNAPLLPSNYRRLFGDYHVTDKVRCCVQKENGKLCDEPHNNGWIIERSDGKLTLVGIDCGVKNSVQIEDCAIILVTIKMRSNDCNELRLWPQRFLRKPNVLK